jgi:excisionase family DNA binding protein
MVDTAPTLETLSAKLDAILARGQHEAPRFLSVERAAAYTSLSVESVRRLLAAGRLTALRPIKGRIVVDRNQLDAYVLGADVRPRTGRGRR